MNSPLQIQISGTHFVGRFCILKKRKNLEILSFLPEFLFHFPTEPQNFLYCTLACMYLGLLKDFQKIV